MCFFNGTKKAFVAGSHSLQNENTFKLEDKGLSHTLFMNKFNMTEDALRKCIMNDEVDVVTHGDKFYVSWRSLKSSAVDKRTTNIQLEGKRMKLQAKEAGQLQALMDDINLENELPDMRLDIERFRV